MEGVLGFWGGVLLDIEGGNVPKCIEDNNILWVSQVGAGYFVSLAAPESIDYRVVCLKEKHRGVTIEA